MIRRTFLKQLVLGVSLAYGVGWKRPEVVDDELEYGGTVRVVCDDGQEERVFRGPGALEAALDIATNNSTVLVEVGSRFKVGGGTMETDDEGFISRPYPELFSPRPPHQA